MAATTVINMEDRRRTTRRLTKFHLKVPENDSADVISLKERVPTNLATNNSFLKSRLETRLSHFILSLFENGIIEQYRLQRLLISLAHKARQEQEVAENVIDWVRREVDRDGLLSVVKREEALWHQGMVENQSFFGKATLPYHKRIFHKNFPADTSNVLVLLKNQAGATNERLKRKIHHDFLPVWNWLVICFRIIRLSDLQRQVNRPRSQETERNTQPKPIGRWSQFWRRVFKLDK
ncbi:hypothetical protein COT97_00240 [Candidatus Falkowbacteria bacterium CG10_big_fil_rev_8_21_14_0_10_39_11]|uniref:Uncharacterized protein n=1 Tax=Candidatus Falkowbacteria bacterium CG10_big_fil_rev_8_21_14_0_10_39_11 TaxID=1974565 RepID=A0A2H0V6H7_9BACT|nr:MAG: hypothetical protein COT97_00240 [Candidatus Falkowbacteria bacterium CG10_big_fil_rev_8_21_14_0_10_39_11]